jgi:hypothetical protein
MTEMKLYGTLDGLVGGLVVALLLVATAQFAHWLLPWSAIAGAVIAIAAIALVVQRGRGNVDGVVFAPWQRALGLLLILLGAGAVGFFSWPKEAPSSTTKTLAVDEQTKAELCASAATQLKGMSSEIADPSLSNDFKTRTFFEVKSKVDLSCTSLSPQLAQVYDKFTQWLTTSSIPKEAQATMVAQASKPTPTSQFAPTPTPASPNSGSITSGGTPQTQTGPTRTAPFTPGYATTAPGMPTPTQPPPSGSTRTATIETSQHSVLEGILNIISLGRLSFGSTKFRTVEEIATAINSADSSGKAVVDGLIAIPDNQQQLKDRANITLRKLANDPSTPPARAAYINSTLDSQKYFQLCSWVLTSPDSGVNPDAAVSIAIDGKPHTEGQSNTNVDNILRSTSDSDWVPLLVRVKQCIIDADGAHFLAYQKAFLDLQTRRSDLRSG